MSTRPQYTPHDTPRYPVVYCRGLYVYVYSPALPKARPATHLSPPRSLDRKAASHSSKNSTALLMCASLRVIVHVHTADTVSTQQTYKSHSMHTAPTTFIHIYTLLYSHRHYDTPVHSGRAHLNSPRRSASSSPAPSLRPERDPKSTSSTCATRGGRVSVTSL